MTELIETIRQKYEFKRFASNGNEMVCICPDCDDRSGHLYINVETGKGWCHRCHKRVFLSTKTHPITPSSIELSVLKPTSIPLHTELLSTSKNPLSVRALEYLKNRGITLKKIAKFQLMWSSTMPGRIIIPYLLNDQVVYWTARRFLNIDHFKGKYIYPQSNRNQLSVSHLLYNFDNVKQRQNLIIVEGVFDAMAIENNVVALGGKSISKFQIELLASKHPRNIFIALDNDAKKDAEMMKIQLLGIANIHILELATKDFGEMMKRENVFERVMR